MKKPTTQDDLYWPMLQNAVAVGVFRGIMRVVIFVGILALAVAVIVTIKSS